MLTGWGCQYRDLKYDRIWLDGGSITFDRAELADIAERLNLPYAITGALSVANSNNKEFTLFVTDHKHPESEYTYYEEVK